MSVVDVTPVWAGAWLAERLLDTFRQASVLGVPPPSRLCPWNVLVLAAMPGPSCSTLGRTYRRTSDSIEQEAL